MENKINYALMQLTRRAESQDPEILSSAFVDVCNIFTILSSKDHQILFGRRGTGKTHALKFFNEHKNASGDISIYVDLRNIGSNTSIYADSTREIQERATLLLKDVFNHIIYQLFDKVINTQSIDNELFEKFSMLQDQLSNIEVIEQKNIEIMSQNTESDGYNSNIGGSFNSGINISLHKKDESKFTSQVRQSYIQRDKVSVIFSGISSAIDSISKAIDAPRIWILLDEWSTIPTELQPFLADLLRRTLFSCSKISVKIGAIEIRSQFIRHLDISSYIGIELGADCQADINLDDFMVFDNDRNKAESFFGELFFKHIKTVDKNLDINTYDEFIQKCFTQRPAFSEIVRAAEGVPRDAINIIMLAAQKAIEEKISVPIIRNSAKTWFERDKSSVINDKSKSLLHWVKEHVIKNKRARGFLLNQKYYNKQPEIMSLVDGRILHLMKRGYSAQDIPGERFDVYFIDYGCYVDLLSTQLAPEDDLQEVFKQGEVPSDDYRSLRRAILTLEDFENALNL